MSFPTLDHPLLKIAVPIPFFLTFHYYSERSSLCQAFFATFGETTGRRASRRIRTTRPLFVICTDRYSTPSMTRTSLELGQVKRSLVTIFSKVFCFMTLTPKLFGAWSRIRTDCLRLMRPMPIPLVLPTQCRSTQHRSNCMTSSFICQAVSERRL